ncbi:YihY family inner membrane protein [Methylomonas sp. LL1]|uniref:YhjD/YihY/BrkB family envelope integrity protein n=1 Tax=Methylomonas sp. LL1 TaxID=2785785 RepID=UPI0018C3B443|nr:YhjD/YihY/BrkB family envelope integrity protein [Methylomonas sp. LL1]QPK63269.1 YihY family inner membrane protein [Methylomonas sp. LL1]
MIFLKQHFKTNLQSVALELKMLVTVLLRELEEGGLKQRAKGLVYTSLLSLAPLLAVSFSILKGFGVHNQVEPLLLKLLAPLGENGVEVSANIIDFVENIQVGVLGFLGFLMLFYTVISLLEQIESCFNHIWRVTKPRSLYRRFSDYLSVLVIGPVLLFSAVGITASMSNLAVVRRLVSLEPFGAIYYLVGVTLPYPLMAAAFGFIYSFIPNTTVKLVPALTGGLYAGLAWKATGALFALFMANSAQYSAIYSGFAVILLSMIWLYISWLILLMGSVIAFHLQFPSYLGYAKRRPHLSIQCQERLALLLMALIGRQHVYGGKACTLKSLADQVNLPWESVAEVLQCLQQGGLLMGLEDEVGYVLARDSDAILLRDIVWVVRTVGDQPDIAIPENESANLLRVVLADLEQGPVAFLHDRRLREIISA